jgi:formylglycine-generating enzyme required for sulfatase activity
MTPELYERLCRLFDQAQTLALDDRLAFLAEVGAAEPELRGALERLLAQDEQARRDGLLQQPCPLNARILLSDSGPPPTLPPEQAEAEPADELVGRKVGPYVIEERIGTGGMGTVYRAARQEGYHQWVAVKVIRPGLDSAEALHRFETERQVLADLPHPHIARLLDGGTLGDGRPYLVMEYIDGLPLDRYCQDRRLGTRERVELLRAVCAAVQHAHECGIVHRDLKPANVLVTADGTPRVTDFGLAKRLEGQGGGAGPTQSGAVLGTPSYMAPEQAAGRRAEVSPATDVYALGAILYELLTGRPPFWADTLWEALRQVLNEEPVSPGRLHPGLPRDLETICLKCLHKQAACRYQSAETLADDLKRWLSNKPIAARPASRLERAVKWARRRPTVASLLGVSVLAGLALAVLSVVAVWQWQSAVTALQQREQERQQKEQEQAERTRAQVKALLSADPQAVPGILDSLAEQRHEVLPSLRAAWQEPDTPLNRRRRMRAALALLEVEPDVVRGELVKWMLEVADPAELIVVRAALQPHAARLRSDLWWQLQAAKVQPDRRLRLLAALAAFDPEGVGWKTVDEKALQPWLADNPLYLGGWTTAFRPAREHLLGPLSKVFRTATPERRAAAASILADYAGDRPRTLVELIVEADDRQFATLLAVLKRHRQEAIGLLTREVDRKAEANWEDQPPRPSWVEPSAAVRKQIEQADGMLAERFALVQTLPLEQFRALARSLSGSGYRPVRFRPYPVGKSIQVAAVWTRDGRDWRLLQGVRAERIRQQDEALRRHGYQPVDVCGWLSPIEPGMERYAGLWAQAPSKQEARLYVGVAQQRHELDGWGPLEKAGLVPLTFQALLAPDGTRRFSSVWGRLSPVPVWRAKYWADQATYEGELTPDRVQLDIAVRRAPPRQTPRESARAELQRWQRELDGKRDNLVGRYYRGVAYSRLGEDRRALEDLDAYLKAVQRYYRPFAERALVLARLGRPSQALEDLQQFRRMTTPASSLPVEALVRVYLGQQVPWPALQQLARQEANNADVLFNLAVVHAQADHWGRLHALAAAVAVVGRPDPLLAALPTGFESRRWGEHRNRAVALLGQAVAADPSRWKEVDSDLRLAPLHDHAGYQALLRRFHLAREYSGVWHGATVRESVELHGLDPAAHLRRCRELTVQGYRVAALGVAETAGPTVVTASVWHRPVLSEAAQEAVARRQSGAALALARLDQMEKVWPVLKHSAYPEARSRLIQRLGPNGVAAVKLAARLETEKDVSVRRALILALGEYSGEQVPGDLRQRLVRRLLQWYRDDPDAGLHGAIDWLLRHRQEGPAARPLDWGETKALDEIDNRLERQDPDGKRNWYVNGQGQTLTVVDARQAFLMGSPGNENGRHSTEKLHWRRIGRRFALGTKPVTVAQFKRFLKAHPEVKHHYTREFSPEEDGPITNLTWYEAAQYCRWLSEQEGVPESEMVYPSVADIEKCQAAVTPLRLPANYLKRKGYRLPTEAEWEFAARAGGRTSRYYGSSVELLPRYAWYLNNSEERTWSVGQKRPNDLGLFDLHGNVWQWCQESIWQYRPGSKELPTGDEDDKRYIKSELSRALRGGAFANLAPFLRSAYRLDVAPVMRYLGTGLRVARTSH